MPATIETHSSTEVSPDSRDSAFSYDTTPALPPAEMDRLRGTAMSRSSEHLRTDSVDSGVGCPQIALQPCAPAGLVIKRTSSEVQQHRSSYNNISIK